MTVPMLFANNASSRLYMAIDAVTTSIRVEDGDGAKFPQPDGSTTYFPVTVEDRRSGQIEIMKCIGRSFDILNVQRGQEGTPAQAFLLGATVSNRLTAATMDFLAHAGATGPQGPVGTSRANGATGSTGRERRHWRRLDGARTGRPDRSTGAARFKRRYWRGFDRAWSARPDRPARY